MADRVFDYISGVEIPATPEEIEATQVFPSYWWRTMATRKIIFKQDRSLE